MSKKDKLPTIKMELFVSEYFKDFNATQAAIRAGYSFKTAHAIGQENLKKPIIKKLIDDHKNDRALANNLTVDDIVADLQKG